MCTYNVLHNDAIKNKEQELNFRINILCRVCITKGMTQLFLYTNDYFKRIAMIRHISHKYFYFV
jgi:hypothetical protein